MSKATILIVEDEAIVAADLAGKLDRLGYEICGTTGRGEEAIELVRAQQPDLILMDIRLAGAMDGVAAAEIIRREIDVPVIFLTAHSDRATLERAKQTEPFGYLLKPFDDLGLETHIEMALYKHQADLKLRQAYAELQSANATLRDARRASLNMMEDALAARRETEEASARLRLSEARYRTLFDTMIEGFCTIEMVFDADGRPVDYRFLEINPAFEKQTGLQNVQGKLIRDLAPDNEEHWFEIYGNIALTGEPASFENEAKALGRYYAVNAYRLGGPESRIVGILFNDITERKQADAMMRTRLHLSELARHGNIEELMQTALDDMELFTGSSVGFFHFVNEDQETLSLQTWSSKTLRDMCQAEGRGLHYPISQAGVWVDCFHERTPVIHNDYPSLPHKKGLPEGHAPVIREVVVPVLRRNSVVAIIGVGNKATDYTQADVDVLQEFASLVMDLVESKRAEDALRGSEERQRLFIEYAPAALAMFDRDMRYIHASQRWRSEYRLGDRDLRGVSHYEVFPEISAEWKEAHRRGMAGEVLRADADLFKRADGSAQWIRWEIRPWFSTADEVGGIVIFAENITDVKQAEEALRRYELLAGNSRDIILFVRRDDGRIQEANVAATEAYGYDREELLSLAIRDLRAPGTLDLTAEQMAEADSHGILFETVHRRKDGRTIPVEVNSRGATINGTRMLLSVIRDITDRKQAEEALKKAYDELENRVAERTQELTSALNVLQVEVADRIQAEQALQRETAGRLRAVEELRAKEQLLMQQSRQAAMGEMIGNIAHQWRQPLNMLGLIIQELPISHELGDCTKEYLDGSVAKAMQVINHMSQTIDDFRNFFRPDKEKVAFTINAVVRNTVSLIEGSFQEQRITIGVNAGEDIPVHGYPNEYSQVILNILINARDAFLDRETDLPRSVRVELFRENDRAVATITDNAGGIPEGIIDKIFDPYFTTKGPDKGTGVGLFMSKAIIEKNMNGRLTARNVGNGAEFRIEV